MHLYLLSFHPDIENSRPCDNICQTWDDHGSVLASMASQYAGTVSGQTIGASAVVGPYGCRLESCVTNFFRAVFIHSATV